MDPFADIPDFPKGYRKAIVNALVHLSRQPSMAGSIPAPVAGNMIRVGLARLIPGLPGRGYATVALTRQGVDAAGRLV
jgi:hypothetical protein